MTAYKCPSDKCKFNLQITNKRSFISHGKTHVNYRELKLPIICSQNGCLKSFYEFRSFGNHLHKFHNDVGNDLIIMIIMYSIMKITQEIP
jgi:hypothetical protein